MDLSSQWTIRFLNYEPVDEALDERMRRIVEDADKIPAEAMSLDKETGVLTIDCARVPGWCDGGRSRLRCLRIGRTFVVKPPWLPYDASPSERVLEIDPGVAFGSALHETTQLSLLAVEKHLERGKSVLDLGTGSGILAIAAARSGALRVHAVDVDEAAVNVARANVIRNGVAEIIEVSLSEGPPWPSGPVDVLIANITYNVLLELMKGIATTVRPGGLLISAGISARHWQDFMISCTGHGFEVEDELHLGPWSALIATRRTQ